MPSILLLLLIIPFYYKKQTWSNTLNYNVFNTYICTYNTWWQNVTSIYIRLPTLFSLISNQSILTFVCWLKSESCLCKTWLNLLPILTPIIYFVYDFSLQQRSFHIWDYICFLLLSTAWIKEDRFVRSSIPFKQPRSPPTIPDTRLSL